MIDLNDNNQNIFIKRGPEIFDSKKAEELSKQVEDDMIEHPGLEHDPIMSSLANEIKKLSKSKGMVDYSGCDNFWIEKEQDGKKITLVSQSVIQLEKEFDSFDELDNFFIDLREFLDQAKYVGKKFKRTAKVDGRDISYMENDERPLVLFATDSNILVLDSFLGETKYEMISPRYFDDGNFEFVGEVDNSYNDKEAVYQAISKQINSKDKTL